MKEKKFYMCHHLIVLSGPVIPLALSVAELHLVASDPLSEPTCSSDKSGIRLT